jgi:phosphohistidine swiveling domain-containing protein
MWVHDLARADAHCGGKALGLSRLIAAGLPVPNGFVIDDNAFKHVAGEIVLDDPNTVGHVLATILDRFATVALPAEVIADIDARADALAPTAGYAVRSSATIEDRHVGAAAGVFSSKNAVPRADLWHAIRGVWVSALTPLAVTYARRRGAPISIGVIIQPFLSGEPVTVYTRRPGAPAFNEVLVQRDTSVARLPRESTDPVVILALRAEKAIVATSGADIELVGEAIVQARPIVHPPRRAQRSGAPPTVTALLVADGRKWTWDITHNPDPLSTAQAELVERVDQAGVAPYSLRVCAGYLYTAVRTPVTAPPLDKLGDIENRLAELVGSSRDRGIGRAPTDAGLEGAPARARSVTGGPISLAITEAIDRYVKFYAIWSNELSPLVAAVRPTAAHARRSSVEGLLLGAARGVLDEAEIMARLGVLSPSWDVVVPTYAERPDVLKDALARAREIVRSEKQAPAEPPRRVVSRIDLRAVIDGDPSALADLGERDDYWFARAQWMVRRALLARGKELGLDAGDVFWLSLAVLADGISVDDARRRAAAARAAAARATRWEMPLVVGDDSWADATTETPRMREALTAQARGDHALRGVGSGGRVQGRVVRFASLASTVTVGRGDVVVARAITPALAVMVIGCRAIVSETGGFLDHGAAMARELGIPCVVGCKHAWTLLEDGMLVTVDGDSGLVTTHG